MRVYYRWCVWAVAVENGADGTISSLSAPFNQHRRIDMKKIVFTAMLVMIITVGFTGSVGAKSNVIVDPKLHASCIDSDGKWINNKQCGSESAPTCGCLFHQIGDFIKDLFA
jgi:hypothetical protein